MPRLPFRKELQDAVNELSVALMSSNLALAMFRGVPDFQPGGLAHKTAVNIIQPAIDEGIAALANVREKGLLGLPAPGGPSPVPGPDREDEA